MAFTTIFTVVIIGYVFLYIGMIIYDLFFKKDAKDFLPKVEDEEIDISDEAGQFKPILIEKDAKPGDRKKENAPPVVRPIGEVTDQKDTEINLLSNIGTDDTEASNRKSLNDIEPKQSNKEIQEHIRELVRQVRLEIAEEEKDEGQAHEAKTVENKPAEIKVEKDEEKPTTPKIETKPSPDSKPQVQESKSKPKPRPTPDRRLTETRKVVRPWQEKPKKPSGPIPIYERKVHIEEENQQTKLCGGVKAEKLNEKLNSSSIEELRALLKRNSDLWEQVDNARQPDEEELEIIRKAESGNREKAPTFTRSKG